ncbi:pentapeptide repeat-containing protein [Bradyrhizobium sp. AZCC 2262]|uniref:pentapeptide repeat-containing protein n=1 Tax=Bradyrhizobium sp. AZCC 2262 TaxID=3117022 RepID=UPI002FF108E0
MTDKAHIAQLKKGVAAWNAWRDENPDIRPDLSGANLYRAQLSKVNLGEVNLREANLSEASLYDARLAGADLRKAKLYQADLNFAKLGGADLSMANLSGARLRTADLANAKLFRANLNAAHLGNAKLVKANLTGADLQYALLVETDLTGADLTGSRTHGVSAWGLKLDGAKQQNLVITPDDEPEVTVDNIEVAQFIYLLLHNEKIRDVIDTIGRKGVLLLGRFTEGRIEILERLRDELRNRGYLPIIFNFDKPETKNFTETVRLLAGLSHFVIADVTNPKSAPLELQATVPEVMVPFRPIIQEGEKPFAMLADLWIQHRDWVFEPLYYSSLDALVGALDEKIIGPAKARFAELLARKAEKMKGEHV